jgi:hypothetical protein
MKISYRQNPYLFLLLKRMVEFEVVGNLGETPNLKQVTELVQKKFMPTTTISEHIRRRVWGKADFIFSERSLDYLCQLITLCGEFSTWENFIQTFQNDKDARSAEAFRYRPFAKLSVNDQKLVKASVEKRLAIIYKRIEHEGKLEYLKRTKYNVEVDDSVNETIRLISEEEIKQVANLANRIYPCSTNDFSTKLPWYKKNPYIFFCYFDRYNELIANINLLPLTTSTYLRLKSGVIYEDSIIENDIISPDFIDETQYVYIEGFASLSKRAQHEFRLGFKKMISKLAKVTNNELIIFSIGGSIEGETLMRNYGFVQTGSAFDKKHSKHYPFLEISWLQLEININRKIAESNIHNY